jgi:MFS family permease
MFLGSTQFAFLLEEDGIRSPATRSLIMSAMTALAALSAYFYGPVQRRLGVRGAFLLGLICVTTALATIGAGKGPVLAIMGAALIGVYIGMATPYLYHVVTERTDAFSRATASDASAQMLTTASGSITRIRFNAAAAAFR